MESSSDTRRPKYGKKTAEQQQEIIIPFRTSATQRSARPQGQRLSESDDITESEPAVCPLFGEESPGFDEEEFWDFLHDEESEEEYPWPLEFIIESWPLLTFEQKAEMVFATTIYRMVARDRGDLVDEED